MIVPGLPLDSEEARDFLLYLNFVRHLFETLEEFCWSLGIRLRESVSPILLLGLVLSWLPVADLILDFVS
jgi:hypothetical protein